MKLELLELAKYNKFNAKFVHENPFKYSENESLRYLFWMTELQKWLREKHYLLVTIYPRLTMEEFKYLINIFDPTFSKIKKGCIETNIMYYKFEEALEDGLIEALKLIKL